MATASPLAGGHPSDALNDGATDAVLLYAQRIDREHPEHLHSLGMSVEEYAAAMAAPGRTIDESVEAGLLSAEEARFILGQATREDLLVLGYSNEEIGLILEEQQARACASSA